MKKNIVCVKCGETQESEFYPTNKSWCKKCNKKYQAQWRREHPTQTRLSILAWKERNPDKVRGYHKKWKQKNPDKVALNNKRWRERHPEKCREYVRNWMRKWASNNREEYNQRGKKWRNEHPQEWHEIRMRYHYRNMEAYRCQWKALSVFPEQQDCEIEDCNELGERHHDDYSKPYEIRWLCKKHHKEHHRKEKAPAV